MAAGWEERECGNAIISNTTASHLLWRHRAAVRRRGHVFSQGLSRAWQRWKRIFCIHAEYVCGWDLHGVHEIANEQCFWRRADVLSRGNSMGDCQRRDGKTGILDWVALLLALTLGTLVVTSRVEAANSSTRAKDGIPAGMYFFLGSVALLSAAGDVRMLWHGGVSGAQRIARHLWRMCFALFIASSPLFLARPQLFPALLRKTGIVFLLGVPPLILMIF